MVDDINSTSLPVADNRMQFEKVFFEEAAQFLKHDNQMALHMNEIVGALAGYLKENPEKSILLFQYGGLTRNSNEGEVNTQTIDFDKLLEKIVDFFLGDKDFFFKLIVLFHFGCDHLPKDWNK